MQVVGSVTITTGLVDTYSTPTLLRMMAAGRLPARHAHDGFGRIRTRRHRARIAERREELGLTRQDMAAPAGTAASYLRYLEEQPAAMLGTSVLICLTDALDTSLAALHCGDIDLRPGVGQAAGRAPPQPGGDSDGRKAAPMTAATTAMIRVARRTCFSRGLRSV